MGTNIFKWLFLILAGTLCFSFMSCDKEDEKRIPDYSSNSETNLFIGLSSNPEEGLYITDGSDFINKAALYDERYLTEMYDGINKAQSVIIYIDAQDPLSDTAMEKLCNQMTTLWEGVLSKNEDKVIIALRIGNHSRMTQRLTGLDVGEGLYLFSTKVDGLVMVEDIDTKLADIDWINVFSYIHHTPDVFSRADDEQSSTDDAANCKTRLVRNIKYYYLRSKPFDWAIEGTLKSNSLPQSSEEETRSAVVDVAVVYEIYSAVGGKDRYISVEIKGNGYKTNIQKRDADKGFVCHTPWGVHNGTAQTGHLIRKYTVTSNLEGATEDGCTTVERLPENENKSTDISITKTHSFTITGSGGGKKGGSNKEGGGSGSVSYGFSWSKTVAYTQKDFEMYNTFSSYGKSRQVIWLTRPVQWFHENAFKKGNTEDKLDAKKITITYDNGHAVIPAGASTIYRDLNSSDFPVGFHTMAPQSAVLYYTTNDSVKLTVTAALQLEDVKQFWQSGTYYESQHETHIRNLSGQTELKIKFLAEKEDDKYIFTK